MYFSNDFKPVNELVWNYYVYFCDYYLEHHRLKFIPNEKKDYTFVFVDNAYTKHLFCQRYLFF